MRCLIIQTKRLGDVIFSTALCQSLKNSWPHCTVDYVVQSEYAELLEAHPAIDSVIVLDSKQRKEIGYLSRFLKKIYHNRYDLVINVQGQIIGLLVSLFSRAKQRIGFAGFPWGLGSNNHVPFKPGSCDQGNGSVIDDRFQLLKPLHLTHEDRCYRVHLSPEEKHQGQMALKAAFGSDTKIIALGVNAAKAYKRWPLSFFVQLAVWLIERFDVNIWVYWGPGEQEYNQSLKKQIPENLHHRIVDTLETPNVRILARYISAINLYIGNDTGPRVISQSLNIPTFGIACPRSDVPVWNPINNKHFRGFSVNDILKLPKAQWQHICDTIDDTAESNLPWLKKITPKSVQKPLETMIDDLGLFARE